MESPGKNTARWRHLANGYNKYWYSKAALRWLSLTTAVVALITFGGSWHDYSPYNTDPYPYVRSLAPYGFTIAAVCRQGTLSMRNRD